MFNITYPNGKTDLFAEYNKDDKFISICISEDGFEILGDSMVNGSKPGELLFNTFEEVCNTFSLPVDTSCWETETGEKLSEYLIKVAEDTPKTDTDTITNRASDTLTKSDNPSSLISIITENLGAGKHRTELPPISLSDDTIRKHANYIIEAVSKKVEEDNKKQKHEISEDTKIKSEDSEEAYDYDDFKKDVFGVNAEDLLDAIHLKNTVLLISPPGNGKTTTAIALSKLLSKKKKSSRVVHLCFNQSTSYSDFIGGLKPVEVNGNEIWQDVKGKFTELCDRAINDSENNYVIILDEINRGNTEGILGECIGAVANRNVAVETNCGFELTVPNNVYIIATMNSMDSSVVSLGVALLDRFSIFDMSEIKIDVSMLNKSEEVTEALKLVAEALDKINNILEKDIYKGINNRIGNRALFNNCDSIKSVYSTVKYDIEPKVRMKLDVLKVKDDSGMYSNPTKAILEILKDLKDILRG